MTINDFILVQYDHCFDKPNLIGYYRFSERMHQLIVKQIRSLYPHANIHLITNRPRPSPDIISHIQPDLEPNNYAKLRIFDLIDEPAMYLDNDILLVRPFDQDHLLGRPFNLYQKYSPENMSRLPEGQRGYPHFNTGIVWVSEPSHSLRREMESRRDEFRIYQSFVNDEYPVSDYIEDAGGHMNLIREVNFPRSDVGECSIRDFQSLHYTGMDDKSGLFDDYFQLKGTLWS